MFSYFLISSVFAQNNTWATLGMVTFTTQYDPSFGIEIKKPTISPVVRTLEGKEIEVSGYFIPLTGKSEQSHFMLSKLPQNMCFFCGKAGPETAMQVFMADNKKVAYSDDKITVKGILRINDQNEGNLMYTLENAQLIK
jgi:hypothetical protein